MYRVEELDEADEGALAVQFEELVNGGERPKPGAEEQGKTLGGGEVCPGSMEAMKVFVLEMFFECGHFRFGSVRRLRRGGAGVRG